MIPTRTSSTSTISTAANPFAALRSGELFTRLPLSDALYKDARLRHRTYHYKRKYFMVNVQEARTFTNYLFRVIIIRMTAVLETKIQEVREWLGPGALNFFGKPFAGKATQAERLAVHFGVRFICG